MTEQKKKCVPNRKNSRSKVLWSTRNKVSVMGPDSEGVVGDEAGEFSGGVFQWECHWLWNNHNYTWGWGVSVHMCKVAGSLASLVSAR